MKIGVIGPSDSLKKIMNLKKDLEEDVLLQAYEAHTLQDAIDLAEKCQSETDGIFFFLVKCTVVVLYVIAAIAA